MTLDRENVFTTRQMRLAWRRITTGANTAYKAYQRDAYAGYEAGRDRNLARLRERLDGDWNAERPLRVHVPKASGLQRTISILELEDQVVLQCLAQAWERRLRARRERLTGRFVFSNVANHPDSDFFLRRWQWTYGKARSQLAKHIKSGHDWVSSFDLAAFYDTIDHGMLLRLVGAETDQGNLAQDMRRWFGTWAFSDHYPGLAHGLPQGPLAADFLADCFLLPVDEALARAGAVFVRYGDDFHLLAGSADAARRATVVLEHECKALGLIAQGGKMQLRQIHNDDDLDELMKSFSNRAIVGPPQGSANADDYHRVLRGRGHGSAVRGRPLVVRDRSEFRYAMYSAPKDRRIRDLATRLLSRHPEYIDELSTHLAKYSRTSGTEREVVRLLNGAPPHSYVEFRLWSLAERFHTVSGAFTLEDLARARVRKLNARNPARWGSFSYLLGAEAAGRPRVSHRIRYEHELSILNAMKSHAQLLMSRPVPGTWILQRSRDGGLVAPEAMALLGVTHRTFNLMPRDLPPATQRALREFGIVQRTRSPKYDPIAKIISTRYGVKETNGWMRLLGPRSAHALGLLRQASGAFEVDTAKWLRLTNSFHELLIRAILTRLNVLGLKGKDTPIHQGDDPTRPLNSLGFLVGKTDFAKEHPDIAGPIRDTNRRRNGLPDSHSEDYRTGKPTRYLKHKERDKLVKELKTAYALVNVRLEKKTW